MGTSMIAVRIARRRVFPQEILFKTMLNIPTNPAEAQTKIKGNKKSQIRVVPQNKMLL